MWVVKANHSRCIELPLTKWDLRQWPSSIALSLQEGSSLEECGKEKLLRNSGCPQWEVAGVTNRWRFHVQLSHEIHCILYWYADKRIAQRCRRAAARVGMLVLGPKMVVSGLLSDTSVKLRPYRN